MRVWRVRRAAGLPVAAAVAALVVSGCQSDGTGTAATLGSGFVAPAPPAPPALPWQGVRYTTATPSAASPSVTSRTSPAITPSAASPLAYGPCLPLYGPQSDVPVTVTTTGRRTLLTWWHNGDPAALTYWVGAFLVDEGDPTATAPMGTPTATSSSTPTTTSSASATPAVVRTPTITWYRLAPPSGCRTVTYSVPGLISKRRYLLILDLEARTPETQTGISRITLNEVGVSAP